MHHVIIGNGVAGITAAFTLRDHDKSARISVISAESDYFISRTALMYAFMDRLALRDLEPFERKTYTVQKIDRIRAQVTNLDAKTVTLHDGRQITYDKLLLATGSVPIHPTWPGLETAKTTVRHSGLPHSFCRRTGVPSTDTLATPELCHRQRRK